LIRLIKAIAIFSLVVFLFVFFYAPIESSDVWWHLSIGRYILQHATFPYADIFSLKDHHPPWIFPQWLGSVFFCPQEDPFFVSCPFGASHGPRTDVAVFCEAAGL
jgi:hypothetical protein